MPQFGWKNCPESTRGQISRLVSLLRGRLDNNLLGVYLHGSLAMGCFNPLLSDVDLLAVTRSIVIVDTQKAIVEELFKLSSASAPLEISLLRQQDLKPWKFPTPYSLHYSEAVRSQFAADLADGAWRKWNEITRTDDDLAAHVTLLRASGVCLWGAPITEVFPEVPREDFLASILSSLAGARERLVQDPVSGILNASRTLAYVREGKILSKDEGGRWAMDHLPNQQLQVIRSVMAVYSGLYEDMYVTAEQVQAVFDWLAAAIEQQTQSQIK